MGSLTIDPCRRPSRRAVLLAKSGRGHPFGSDIRGTGSRSAFALLGRTRSILQGLLPGCRGSADCDGRRPMLEVSRCNPTTNPIRDPDRASHRRPDVCRRHPRASRRLTIGRSRWIWAWILPVALVAGPVAWVAGESTLDVFVLTDAELKSGDFSMTPTDKAPYHQAKRRVTIRNSALHYGILGVTLGIGLDLAGGMTRRTLGGAIRGVLVGAIACGVSAVLASLALIPVFLTYYSHDQPKVYLPLLVHGGIWSAIGAGGAGPGRRAGRRSRPAGQGRGGRRGRRHLRDIRLRTPLCGRFPARPQRVAGPRRTRRPTARPYGGRPVDHHRRRLVCPREGWSTRGPFDRGRGRFGMRR